MVNLKVNSVVKVNDRVVVVSLSKGDDISSLRFISHNGLSIAVGNHNLSSYKLVGKDGDIMFPPMVTATQGVFEGLTFLLNEDSIYVPMERNMDKLEDLSVLQITYKDNIFELTHESVTFKVYFNDYFNITVEVVDQEGNIHHSQSSGSMISNSFSK